MARSGERVDLSDVPADYPGTNPFPFTGGTVAKAIVDVSGEPFIDLEKEAIAMMARE